MVYSPENKGENNMAHLLIDTVKTDSGKKYIPFGTHRVRLFADKKSATPFRSLLRIRKKADGKKNQSGSGRFRLLVLRKSAVRAAILAETEKILAADPKAEIAVISPRRKLRLKLGKLQQRHPDARIFCGGKLGKKARCFLSAGNRPSENISDGLQAGNTEQENENDIIAEAAVQVHAAATAVLLPPPQHPEPAADTSAVPAHIVLLIRKNRPKKKAALLALLEQQHAADAAALLVGLQQQGYLKIDAAENVRYL